MNYAVDYARGVEARRARVSVPVWVLPYVLCVADIVAIYAGVVGAVPILEALASSPIGAQTAAGYASAVVLCYLLVGTVNGFDPSGSRSYRGRPVRTLYVGLLAFVIPLVVPVLMGATRQPISFVAIAFPLGLGLLLGFRLVFDAAVTRLGTSGRLLAQRIVMIRANVEAEAAAGAERELASDGVRTLARFDLSAGDGEASDVLREVVRFTETTDVDEVFIIGESLDSERLGDALTVLSDQPLPVRFLPNASLRRLIRGRVEMIGAHRVFELQRPPLNVVERAVKRTIDIAGALFGLVLLSPLFAAVAVLIKLDSEGPVFFRQTRIGFCGREFRIYKFRSMRTMDDGDVVRQASRDDDRVTRIGRWLRANSVDELPQLINVLNGDMSLIGPRPHARAHHEQYLNVVAFYARRHQMKPGITGWAQANGFRGETPTLDLMERRVEHDLWYIRNWSIWLDVRTVLLTIWTLFASERAY